MSEMPTRIVINVLLDPAIEREIRSNLTEQADRQAIDIFGENLRHLLLQSPLKKKK